MRFIKNDPAALAAHIESLKNGLILFDGRPTAGKTHLAKEITSRLGCGVLDGDAFIVRKQDQFIGALKADTLREEITAALAARPRKGMFEIANPQANYALKLSFDRTWRIANETFDHTGPRCQPH
jgi:hypothetical protein